MTVTAVCNELFSLCKCILKVRCLVHCKYGRELFMCELLADVYALDFAYDYLCVLGSLNSCELCYLVSTLTNDLCVECAIDDDGLADLFCLLGIEEIAASVGKLRFYCVVYAAVNDH